MEKATIIDGQISIDELEETEYDLKKRIGSNWYKFLMKYKLETYLIMWKEEDYYNFLEKVELGSKIEIPYKVKKDFLELTKKRLNRILKTNY